MIFNKRTKWFRTVCQKLQRAYPIFGRNISGNQQVPTLRREMLAPFDQLEKGEDADEFKIRLKSIWDTWADVENTMNN